MKKIFALVFTCLLVLSLCSCSLFGATITDISLSESDIQLEIGSSKQIDVNAKPENAVLSKLTWTTSDNAVATVEDGLVKAIQKGSAVIKVTTENGISKACNITVVDKAITEITLSSTSASVDVGKTLQLTAEIKPENATNKNLSWKTDDKAIATVNSEGKVTAVKAGVTNITCSANGVEASCTVTVKGESKDDSDSKENVTIIYQYGHYNPNYTYRASDFVFPESSIRKLSDQEIRSTLSSMSGGSVADSYAQDAINEIYARNGYIFKTPSIKAYYESKPWYYADSNFSTSDFSDIENYNINLLSKYS